MRKISVYLGADALKSLRATQNISAHQVRFEGVAWNGPLEQGKVTEPYCVVFDSRKQLQQAAMTLTRANLEGWVEMEIAGEGKKKVPLRALMQRKGWN